MPRMTVLLVIILVVLKLVTGAPPNVSTESNHGISNNTRPSLKPSPSFVPEPKGRGTLGLVLSCVLTLILCVWTAIHLNITLHDTGLRYIGRKISYVLIGLFASEILLAISHREWLQALEMLKVVRCAAGPDFAKNVVAQARSVLDEISAKFPEQKVYPAPEAALAVAGVWRAAEAVDLAAQETQAAIPPDSGAEGASEKGPSSLQEQRKLLVKAGKTKLAARRAALALCRAEGMLSNPPGRFGRFWRRVSGPFHAMRMSLLGFGWWGSGHYDKENDIGLEGAFFVVMGGYTCSTLDRYSSNDALTFNVAGLSLLLEQHVISTGSLA